MKLLDDLKAGKELKLGPQISDRKSCEPRGGLTSLTSEIPPVGTNVRSDL